jgi:hypothetical protein
VFSREPKILAVHRSSLHNYVTEGKMNTRIAVRVDDQPPSLHHSPTWKPGEEYRGEDRTGKNYDEEFLVREDCSVGVVLPHAPISK